MNDKIAGKILSLGKFKKILNKQKFKILQKKIKKLIYLQEYILLPKKIKLKNRMKFNYLLNQNLKCMIINHIVKKRIIHSKGGKTLKLKYYFKIKYIFTNYLFKRI